MEPKGPPGPTHNISTTLNTWTSALATEPG